MMRAIWSSVTNDRAAEDFRRRDGITIFTHLSERHNRFVSEYPGFIRTLRNLALSTAKVIHHLAEEPSHLLSKCEVIDMRLKFDELDFWVKMGF